MQIGIVEDDADNMNTVKNYVERFQEENGTEFTVSLFADGEEITEDYSSNFDIIFMDIEMKHIDGMTAAKYIRKLDEDVIIVFITNSAQYALKGYSVNALGYLLKPLNYFAFSETLSKALKIIHSRKEKYVLIFKKEGMIKLPARDITYVECIKHKLVVHTVSDEEYSYFQSLKEFEKNVGNNFIRCNNGYLVNLRHVKAIKNEMVVVGNTELIISRPKRKAFLEALNRFYGGLTT